jgi:hypothetical protein
VADSILGATIQEKQLVVKHRACSLQRSCERQGFHRGLRDQQPLKRRGASPPETIRQRRTEVVTYPTYSEIRNLRTLDYNSLPATVQSTQKIKDSGQTHGDQRF